MKQTCRSFHALTVSTEIHTSYATLWSVTYAMEYPTGHSYFSVYTGASRPLDMKIQMRGSG